MRGAPLLQHPEAQHQGTTGEGGEQGTDIGAAVQDETTINTHIRNTAPGDALLSE